MSDRKKVPMQISYRPEPKIDEEIAREAYKEYVAQFGGSQTFERLHERGGFGELEIIKFLFNQLERLQGKEITKKL